MNKYMPFVLPVLRSIFFIVGGMSLVFITNLSYDDASRWWTTICIIVNIVTIGVLILICRKEGVTFGSLFHYKKEELRSRYTLGIVLSMLFIGIGGMYGFGFIIYGNIPVMMIQPIPITFAILNIVLLPLTIVLSEFPLYFGYSLNKIDKMTGHKWLAIAYPMFFYALQHSFIPLIFHWQYMLFRFLAFLPLLIFLGVVYYHHRKLVPLMVGHGILDFATAVQILIMSIFPAVFEMLNNV